MDTRRNFIGAAAMAGAVSLLPPGVRAQAAGEKVTFKAMSGATAEGEWGSLSVPENRRDPKSRRITLRYIKFKATTAKPGYPLVYLAGGPGGSGVGTARGPRFPIFMALREVGDVIVFDQRGTGASNELPAALAPLEWDHRLTRQGVSDYYVREFNRNWAAWKAAGVSAEGYNTIESAHDLDDLRKSLGAEKLNLWGISYGSHLGQAALKYHEGKIERIALASLEGLDQTVKRPGRLDGYMAQVDALVKADPAAAKAYPDLLGMMRRVHERLEANPAPFTGPFGPGRAPMTFALGGFIVQMIAGGLIKNPSSLAQLPKIYASTDAGNYAFVAQQAAGQLGQGSPVNGMGDIMDLASGISPAKLAMVQREAKTAVFGDSLNFPMPHLSGAVPGVDLGEAFRRPISTRIPALLISGTLDGRTPIAEQAEVAAQFQRKTWIKVENAGHDVLETSPEIARRLVAFFKGEAVDPSPIKLSPMKFAV
ncbi:alpha/beta fold hydrolase [soil metagenome]